MVVSPGAPVFPVFACVALPFELEENKKNNEAPAKSKDKSVLFLMNSGLVKCVYDCNIPSKVALPYLPVPFNTMRMV